MPSRKSFTISEDRLLDLVAQIYDAGLDASRWNQTLKSMAEFFQAEQINLRIIDPDSHNMNRFYFHNRDPFWIQVYKDYYYQVDPWMEMLHNSDKPIIACTHHILSDREYRQLEIYNDYIVPTDIHFGMGGLLKVGRDFNTYIGMQRGYNRGEFHNDLLRIFKRLVPHVNRALHICQRTQQLEFQQSTLMQALNRINSPVLLVNEMCQTLFVNSAAEALLEQHKGISIHGNGIQLSDAQQSRRLAELIFNATVGKTDSAMPEAGGMFYQHAPYYKSLSILVSPLNREGIDFEIKGNKSALVIFSDPGNRARPAEELLTELYHLTDAEARVASLLCGGLTMNDICEQLHLSLNTVKTHLKSVFQKTGTRRQAELVNLINTGPVGILNQD